MEKILKPAALEPRLRELFGLDRLYTIDDLVRLTGHKEQYVRTTISNLQNARYRGNPLPLKWKRCSEDNIRRVGNEYAETICQSEEK